MSLHGGARCSVYSLSSSISRSSAYTPFLRRPAQSIGESIVPKLPSLAEDHSGSSDSAKRKAGTIVPASSLLRSLKKVQRLFFFLATFLVFFLAAFFFGFDFFVFFFGAGFFFAAFLAGFFAAGLGAGFGAGASSSGSSPTITSSSSSVSTISSVSPASSSSSSLDSSLSSSKLSFSKSIPSSPGRISGPCLKGSFGSLFWPEYLKIPPRP